MVVHRALDIYGIAGLVRGEFVQVEFQGLVGLGAICPNSHDFMEDPLLPLNGSHFLADFLWNLPPAPCHMGLIPTDDISSRS